MVSHSSHEEESSFYRALLLALPLWGAFLYGIGILLSTPQEPPVASAAVDARIVEIPERIEEAPLPQASPRPQVTPAPLTPVIPSIPKPNAEPPPPVPMPASPPTPTAPALTTPVSQPPVAVTAPVTAGNALGSDNMGARILTKKSLEVPEEFRDQPMKLQVKVRFHIEADGRFKIELITPTENPAINRSIKEQLKQVQVAPAIKNGVPVSSTLDVSYELEVTL